MTLRPTHIPGPDDPYVVMKSPEELNVGDIFAYSTIPDSPYLCTGKSQKNGRTYWKLDGWLPHSKSWTTLTGEFDEFGWWSRSGVQNHRLYSSEIPYDPNGEGETDDDI